MKKITLIASLMLLVAGSAFADDEKHQTYISYDDGGTLVRPADDAREIEARVNLPIFPGDEVITNRRGRTEVVLADGNVIGLDQATAVRFVSVLDSYEGDADETIAELRYGKVAIYRIEDAREHFRLDTPSATYFASDEAIFSVETDSRGRDRVSVLDGVIEIRTPARSTRLARGEQADIDDRGMYDIASFSTNAADDFERWFLDRADRYGDAEGRYLDRSLAYYEDDLSRHGSWVHTSHYGWAWRPSVAAGWRPYHNGYWMRGYSGCLTWVSYEPWGWVPYHYGRWSHDPYYGWFWVPGIGYAPAWVYWWYGNGYLGWAPSGWWDLHRHYYNWNYRPYHRAGLSLGFGFYGRVKVSDLDLRPWTFIDANTIHSNRVDRAALTTDAIRDRLSRDKGGFATVSSDPARFTREEFRDPAAAINRRWTGVDTGRAGAGPANVADLTPYIRRDNELPNNIRERVLRGRPSDGNGDGARAAIGTGGGGGATIGGGGLAPIGGGNVAPIGGGALAPIAPSTDAGRDRVNRGNGGTTRTPTTINRRPVPAPAPRQETPAVTAPETPKRDDSSWRGRVSRPSARDRDTKESGARATPPARSSSDVPRRVIDRIGGARVQSGSRTRSATPSRDRSSSSSSGRSRVARPSSGSSGKSSSPPPRASSGSSGGSSSSGKSSSRGSESRSGSSGGRIKRDQ